MSTNEHIDSLLSFRDMRYANSARQNEWDGDAQFSMLFFSNALAGEVGEAQEVIAMLALGTSMAIASGKAANVVKKLERKALGLAGSEATIEDLGDELADVLTYVDLLAKRAGLNLADVWVRKFNRVSDKYGMKTHINQEGGVYFG